MIFDDKLLDYEDILECRLVSRGWRDLVQDLGLMKCAELYVSSKRMMEEVLENNLFLGVGTLYLSLDYGDYDDDEWDDINDNINKMFTAISESESSPLDCLKVNGLQVDPEALGKVVCLIPTVEVEEIQWSSSEDLEHFLNKILECESPVLESLTFKNDLFGSMEEEEVLTGVDPTLLGNVAVKMRSFKFTGDVRFTEAILQSISEEEDVKLQDLQLDVWLSHGSWGRKKKNKIKKMAKYQNVHDREDFYEVYEEELETIESKLKSVEIRIDGYKDDEIGCDHDYPKPWCDSCQGW